MPPVYAIISFFSYRFFRDYTCVLRMLRTLSYPDEPLDVPYILVIIPLLKLVSFPWNVKSSQLADYFALKSMNLSH